MLARPDGDDTLNSTRNREVHLAADAPAIVDDATRSQAVTALILETLDDAKAEAVVDIDMEGRSALADRMIIASGRSHRHVNAVSDRLLRDLKDAGFGTAKVEGMPTCDWVLVDTGDVIVHVFRPEVRDFYNLEKMWQVSPDDGNGRKLDA